MARLARLTVPGHPHHIIQRGNNRQLIFTRNADFEMLLSLVNEHARMQKVAIHAYVLMSNHFHLLATPETADGIPRLMQAVGRRYVRYFNQSYLRTGTLWEGRYKSTLIQAEHYLLACMIYLDLNPVRAKMVSTAADYRWSSYHHYAGQTTDHLITSHPLYWEMGNTPFAREVAYVAMVDSGIGVDQQKVLTESALHGWVLGDGQYIAALQKQTPRRIAKKSAGRPLKPPGGLKR